MPAAYSEFTGKKQKPHPGGAQKRELPQPTFHARNDSSAQTRETPYTTNAPKGRILKSGTPKSARAALMPGIRLKQASIGLWAMFAQLKVKAGCQSSPQRRVNSPAGRPAKQN